MNAPVAHQLRGHAEGLAAVRALVALRLCVNAPMVLIGHEVGELLLAGGTVVSARLVTILMVEQGAGVPVPSPALITHMGAGSLPWRSVWVARLHEGEVQAGAPAWFLVGVSMLQVQPEAGLTGKGARAQGAGQLPAGLVGAAPVVLKL